MQRIEGILKVDLSLQDSKIEVQSEFVKRVSKS